MTRYRIVSHCQLRDEMIAVARGRQPTPPDAAGHSFQSANALMRLLTPENRQLLAIVRDRKPQPIAELAAISGRAAPNLTCTIAKMEAAGFVKMEDDHRRKVPTAIVHKLTVEIDLLSQNDRLERAENSEKLEA